MKKEPISFQRRGFVAKHSSLLRNGNQICKRNVGDAAEDRAFVVFIELHSAVAFAQKWKDEKRLTRQDYYLKELWGTVLS